PPGPAPPGPAPPGPAPPGPAPPGPAPPGPSSGSPCQARVRAQISSAGSSGSPRSCSCNPGQKLHFSRRLQLGQPPLIRPRQSPLSRGSACTRCQTVASASSRRSPSGRGQKAQGCTRPAGCTYSEARPARQRGARSGSGQSGSPCTRAGRPRRWSKACCSSAASRLLPKDTRWRCA
ncbi:MAG: hypothetical protein FJ125_00405, partial [Deltaproteobacteria bacterium]|nr:hypothetical protein [Deltaproteobacteria bacterium]